jgi:hypothetical protein
MDFFGHGFARIFTGTHLAAFAHGMAPDAGADVWHHDEAGVDVAGQQLLYGLVLAVLLSGCERMNLSWPTLLRGR